MCNVKMNGYFSYGEAVLDSNHTRVMGSVITDVMSDNNLFILSQGKGLSPVLTAYVKNMENVARQFDIHLICRGSQVSLGGDQSLLQFPKQVSRVLVLKLTCMR